MVRILSLEYDPWIAEALCAGLQAAGYEALATSDVHEALLILRTQSIDLLTLGLGTRSSSPPPSLRRVLPELFRQDWPVPAMNGEEFLRLLKDDPSLRHIPVLILTGFGKAQCARYFKEFGLDFDHDVDGYVSKTSLISNEFLDAVNVVLKKHGKQPPPGEQQSAFLDAVKAVFKKDGEQPPPEEQQTE